MKTIKLLKKNRRALIVTIVLLIICIVSIYIANYFDTLEKGIPSDYNLLMAEQKDVENEYVEVTIVDVPYIFAIEEKSEYDRKYYFVYDENDYAYIVRLTDSKYSELENMYNNDKEEFSYTIAGYIFDLPDPIKELAKEAYNEALEEEVINDSNFRQYFGNTYLDEVLTPHTEVSAIMIGVAIGVGCLATIFGVIYIIGIIKSKKILKKYYIDDLEYELSKETVLEYPKQEIYLTDKYIISTDIGLKILEYNEIIWLYNEKRSYNAVPIGNFLIAYTDQDKKIQIASTYFKGNVLIEIIEKIKEKNPKIMVGFSKENQQKYKEIKKSKKEIKKL